MGDDLAIDYDDWRNKTKPHGISACIRVRNEGQFMAAAVRSVIDHVDEVVLCVQPSEDDTFAIAADLYSKYPDKVRPVFYPLVPGWIDTPAFYNGNPDEPGHLVHMSNWALSKCRYSWILKVEGDVIALPTLPAMIKRVLEDNRPAYYGLVILNVAGKEMNKISWENPRNGGWDVANGRLYKPAFLITVSAGHYST
jgi:glycosyltransferase involved in cell wall biosynthesis